MKTLDRIRLRATVPEGLVHQLAALPSPKQVNHHIMAAMLRPLTNVAGVLGFCDTFECVLDDEQSRQLIESIRNGAFIVCAQLGTKTYITLHLCQAFIVTEICEALSCPPATTTVTNTNTITTTATSTTTNTITTTTAATAAAVVSTNTATTVNTTTTTNTNIATTANTAPTAAMATTVNMIKPITFNESVPLSSTTEHLAADHNSTGSYVYIILLIFICIRT